MAQNPLLGGKKNRRRVLQNTEQNAPWHNTSQKSSTAYKMWCCVLSSSITYVLSPSSACSLYLIVHPEMRSWKSLFRSLPNACGVELNNNLTLNHPPFFFYMTNPNLEGLRYKSSLISLFLGHWAHIFYTTYSIWYRKIWKEPSMAWSLLYEAQESIPDQ